MIDFIDESTTSNNNIVTWFWTEDSPQNMTSNLQNPSFSWAVEGLYTLCLTVTDDQGAMDDTCQLITILDGAFANAGPDQSINCYTGAVTLDGSGSSQGPEFTYEWYKDGAPAGNTISVTVMQGGTYTLLVTNTVTGCVGQDEVIVVEDFSTPTVLIVPPPILTCVQTEVVLDGSGSSSGAGIAYQWTTPDGSILTPPNENTVTVDAPGTYTLIVTDTLNGCFSQTDVSVVQDVLSPIANAGEDTVSTCLGTIALDGSGSSTGPNFTYTWSTPNGSIVSGGSTLFPVVDAAGSYTLIVTDATNGCFASDQMMVFDSCNCGITFLASGFLANFTCVENSICENNDSVIVEIDFQGTDSNATITNLGDGIIMGDDPSTTADGTIVVAGLQEGDSWHITLTGGACNWVSQGTVPSNYCGFVSITNDSMQQICGPSLALDYTSQDPGPGYSFQWSTSDGVIASGANGLTPVFGDTGIYELVITEDASGCTLSETIEVAGNTTGELTVETIDIQNVSCQEQSDGSIDIEVSCGVPPYTFSWSNGASSEDLAQIQAGTYIVTVTDGLDSTAVLAVDVIDGSVLVYNTIIVDVSCFGGVDGSIEITPLAGTLPFTYEWSNGFIGSPITNLSVGDYCVTITNGDGCTAVECITVSEPPELFLNSPIINCANPGMNDGSITILVAGGTPPYLYEWSDANLNGQSNPQNLPQALYSITVTDANQCTVTGDISTGTIVSLDIDAEICFGEVYHLGGNEYTISGDYIDTLFSATSCVDTLVNLTLNVIPPALSEIELDLCESDTFEFGGQIITTTGIYKDTLPASSGCDSIITLDIEFIPDFNFQLNDVDTICGDSLLLDYSFLNPGPDYAVFWTTTGGLIHSGEMTLAPTVGDTGLYVLMIVNTATACVTTDTTEIVGNTSGELTIVVEEVQDVSCGGTADGYIDISVYCGTPPYQFMWSNGASTPDINNLPGGTYALTVTDDDGEMATLNVTLTEATPIVISFGTMNIPCSLGDSLVLEITATGGCLPYHYLWSTGDTSSILFATAIGEYCVTVTDCNGCSTVACYQVTAPNPIEISVNDVSCASFGSADGAIDIDVSGGAPPYTFQWFDFSSGVVIETTEDLTDVPDGQYYILVSDANGCLKDTLIDLNAAVFDVVTPDISATCLNSAVQLQANVPGGVVEWSPATGLNCTDCPDPVFDGSTVIIYSVAGENASGCRDTVSIQIQGLDSTCVWPGDTDTNKVVNNFDLLNIGIAYDSVGPTRPGASLIWEGQQGPDWSQSTPMTGVNYKHIDTDGNGIINADDTLAITQNWGSTHNFWNPDEEEELWEDESGLLMNAPFYVEPDTLIPGETTILDIVLGDIDNPVENLYGLAFSITYDTSIIEPNSAFMHFDPSWLGIDDDNMISIQKDFYAEGLIDVAITRIDGIEITGEGLLCGLEIIVQDDVLLRGPNEAESGISAEAVFAIVNTHLINFSEEEIEVVEMETLAPIDNVSNTITLFDETSIQVFPNPASKQVNILAEGNQFIEEVQLIDVRGKIMMERAINGDKGMFPLTGISEGVYYLKVFTADRVFLKKLVISHSN